MVNNAWQISKGEKWSIKNVKDKDLIKFLAISEIKYKSKAYTKEQYEKQQFFFGVYRNVTTRLENNRKR